MMRIGGCEPLCKFSQTLALRPTSWVNYCILEFEFVAGTMANDNIITFANRRQEWVQAENAAPLPRTMVAQSIGT
jgi:hypothetical protein